MNIKKLKKEVIKFRYILIYGIGNIQTPLYYYSDENKKYSICMVTSDITKAKFFKTLKKAKFFVKDLSTPYWKIAKISI